jgi:hypothetical protein
MSTESESNQPTLEKYQYNNFRRPRTYPKKWDVSAFSSTKPMTTSAMQSMTQNEGDEEFDLSPEMGLPDVSFSDWHLGPHLDELDKPECDHFSAY